MFSGILSTNCTDDALAAIRAAFHGCLPGDGGCDGSVVLAQEYERTENDGLADISVKLGNLATKYSVGTAKYDTVCWCSSNCDLPARLPRPNLRWTHRPLDRGTRRPLPVYTDTAEYILS